MGEKIEEGFIYNPSREFVENYLKDFKPDYTEEDIVKCMKHCVFKSFPIYENSKEIVHPITGKAEKIKQPITEQDLFDIGFRFLGEGQGEQGNNVSGMQKELLYRLDKKYYSYILHIYPFLLEQGLISYIEKNDVEIEDSVVFSAYRECAEMEYSSMNNIHAYTIDDLLTVIRLL